MYANSTKNKEGKLRLLYEANPIAVITEQARGKTISGNNQRTLDIVPTEIHQRVPFFCGSAEMIEKLESFLDS